MHAHVAQVGTETRLEKRPRAGIERLTGRIVVGALVTVAGTLLVVTAK